MYDQCFGRRVLIIAPHPDDEVIGCGGTILRFRADIEYLAIIHLTGAEDRLQEYRNVHRRLKVNSHRALNFEDGFCGLAARKLTLAVVDTIQAERPDVVLVPHPAEAHADHQAASTIARDAVQKARYWESESSHPPHRVPTVLEYEVWTAIEAPMVVYDISAQVEAKTSLLAEYASQADAFPYLDYVRSLNGWRGMLHFCRGYAEAFAAYTI